MSAKCKFTPKMEPLVFGLRMAANGNKKAFEDKINEYFEDSDKISEMYWMGGDIAARPIAPMDVLAQRLGDTSTEIFDKSARDAYGDEDSEGYKSMKNSFIHSIVERVIFNPETKEWFDPTKEIKGTGYTQLDKAIFDYKISLVNSLRFKLELSQVNLDITSSTINDELTNVIDETINAYLNNNREWTNKDLSAAKLQYVILSNFNDLLAEHTPFIEVKRLYKQSGTQAVDMYSYSGPRANLRTTWTKNEIVSASEQYSKLAETLLNYFQEYDNGFIDNTSIGVDGFTGAMKVLSSAILYSGNVNLRNAKEEYYKGAQMDMAKVIEDYISLLDLNLLSDDFTTFLKQKLNGILYNIYKNDSIPQDIKNLFTGMFFKTVSLKYRTYGNYKGGFRGANLEETWKNNQNYRLQDTINGKVGAFRENPEAWQAIKTSWGVRLSEDSDNQSGDILFSFKEGLGNPVELKIHYSNTPSRRGGSKFEFTIEDPATKTYNGRLADKLIYQITGYLVTPEYRAYSGSSSKNNGILNDFAGALGIAVLGSISNGQIQPFRSAGILDTAENTIDFYRGALFSQLDTPATIASLVNGSETANTVRDVNGNNLPTNGLTSLAYQIDEFLTRYKDTGGFKYSLLGLNPNLVSIPVIREGISIDGSGKKTSSFNVRELYECSIIFDFLAELDNGTVYMQPTTNADKTKTFVPGFNLNSRLRTDPNSFDTIDLKSLITKIANGNGDTSVNGVSARDQLDGILMKLRYGRLNELAQKLISQYNDVLGTNFDTLNQIDVELAKRKLSDLELRKMFRSAGYNFIEDVTSSKGRINETLLNKIDTFNGDPNNDKYQKRLDRVKRRFVEDLISDGFRLNPYLSKGGRLAYNFLGSDWVDTTSRNVILAKAIKNGSKTVININKANISLLSDPNYKITINPILEAYQYADMLLSDSYNFVSIGEDFSHANKNKVGSKKDGNFDVSEWLEFSEASRWVSSVKRNVIPGASMHPFLQGMWDGVADWIKVACMSDIDAKTFNMVGIVKDNNDSMDGSGFSNIWEVLLEQNSLLDAGTRGYDLKTIGWDLDENGIPFMLKWAVYGITNERRRKGYLSKVDLEGIYKRMNDIRFNKHINLVSYFSKYVDGGFYLDNKQAGKRYFVTDANAINVNGRLIYYRRAQIDERVVYLDKYNNEHESFNPAESNLYEINTIYDLDQFFGGAWAYRMDGDRLVNDDLNYRAVFDIICTENLKDYFIAYAVNKSAAKVGVRNLNEKDVWFDKNQALDYFEMSTRHIGLQMNAEHELLDAEVTEMTQMISALAENWYAGELVEQIYKDIGAIVEESLADINISINTNDRDKLRIKFGRSLIESFDKKEDTIGLAQAFLNKARLALSNNEVPNIPFSAATINGAFIADVASRITKSGIRRKYDGIAAVLSPAYNVMSYFRFIDDEGTFKTITAEYVPSEIRAELQRRGLTEFENTSIYDLVHYAYVQNNLGETVLNPFAEIVENNYDLQQGDTIIIEEILKDDTVRYSNPIVIESWDDYDKYVNLGNNYTVRKLKYAPKELQGADTKLTVNGREYSIYNLNSVRALHQLRKGDATLATLIVQDEYWADDLQLDENGQINLKRSIQNIIQHQLEDLEHSLIHDSLFGTETQVAQNVNVIGGECIMGKMNAEKFGLRVGDRIDEILEQGSDWFYNRFATKYGIPNDIPLDLGNAIVYTANGPTIIKFGDFVNPGELGLSRNTRIKTSDGNLILNDEILCKSDNTKLYNYNVSGQSYNVICINNIDQLNEILDSSLVEAHRFIVTRNTLRQYLDFTGDTRFNETLNLVQSGQITSDQAIEYIANRLTMDLTDELKQLSKQRFWAFKASLNVVGARIPTQAMQSFMPMRVVAFTDDEYNVIYVPRQQLWLQGSDLDIDKVYCLQYSIAQNGTLPTMSRLSRYYNPEEVLKLGKPNKIHYVEEQVGQDKANTYEVSYEDLVRTLDSKEQSDQLRTFRDIIQSGKTKISFVAPPNVVITETVNGKTIRELNYDLQSDFNAKKKQFRDYLNLHSQSEIHQNKEAALRNQVVSGILTATLKPSIQINANMPVDMSEAQAAGESSVLGDLEKRFTPDIPSSKFKLQEQALGAKDVVGISAVSVKCFFAETTYMNMTMKGFADTLISGNEDFAMQILSNLVMRNPLTNKAALVANVNVKRIINRLKRAGITHTKSGLAADFNENGWFDEQGFNIIQCLKDLGDRASVVDTALSESGLLSSATDNMKELILPKINATAQFVDIYTTLLATGIPFADIATIMTSPMFTEMSKLTQFNLLDKTTSGYRLKRALQFYLNENTLPRVKRSLLKEIFEQSGQSFESDSFEDLLSATKNINLLKKALDKAYTLRTQRADNYKDNDYYNGDEDLLLEDFFNGDLLEAPNKVTLSEATLEDLNYLINYLEECVNREELFANLDRLSSDLKYKRFGNSDEQLSKLKIILEKVLPKTEEQQIFGRMLGINQGLRTDAYGMHRMVRSIENFINQRFYDNHIDKTFSLYKFLSDEAYQQDMIKAYNLVKSSFNILDAITTVPHFSKMFNAIYTNEFVQGTLSSKHEIVSNLARQLEYNNPYSDEEPYSRILNEKEYREVERYVNNWYITGWLTEQNITFKVPTNIGVYHNIKEATINSSPETVRLNDLYGMATFKRYMERVIIPRLQQMESLQNNSFIMSLEYAKRQDKKTHKWNRFYRLPLNMMTIGDSVLTTRIYEQYLRDFNNISEVEFSGQKLGDLFFIYNLIVNKDGFGQTSLTKIFESLIAAKRGSALVNSFYDYIADIDKRIDRTDLITGLVDNIDDLEAQIQQNVTGTNIENKKIFDLLQEMNSDFTFGMPNAAKNWMTIADKIYPLKETLSWGKVKLDKATIKSEIINNLKHLVSSDNVIIAPQSWFNREFANDELAKTSPAFIHNGKIYIKQTDTVGANVIAHEFAHVILAGLRFGTEAQRNFYYDVVGKIDVDIAKRVFGDEISEYEKFRVGIDLKEEIFAKYLENWMDNKIASIGNIGQILQDNTNTIKDVINSVFGTDLQKVEDVLSFTRSSLVDAVDAVGSSLFQVDWSDVTRGDFLIDVQRIAAWKNFLANRSEKLKLEEDCNGV